MQKKIVLYQISDLHIATGFHSELLHAARELRALIETDAAREPGFRALVVIAGDVFHNHSSYSQYDIVCFQELLAVLRGSKPPLLEVLSIPGNHDYVAHLDAQKVVDLILPLTSEFPWLHHCSRSGVVLLPEFPELEFHILSPVDNKVPKEDEGRVKVAVLHEPITGCRLYGSASLQTARFTVSSLLHYNLVLAGDIHRPQFLTERVAYAGSFIQRSRGEELEHGCIRWELTWTWQPQPRPRMIGPCIAGRFQAFPLASAFLKVLAEDDEVKEWPRIPKTTRIRSVHLEYRFCTPEFLSVTTNRIYEEFGRLDGSRDLGGCLTPALTLELEHVLPEDLDHLELLREKLQGNPRGEEILELYQRELAKLEQPQRRKWTLNYLYWSNLFCYGERNLVEFQKLRGITSIIGRNASGKSSLLDILAFVLFNTQVRGVREGVLRRGAGSYEAQCSFTQGGEEFLILRTGTSKSSSMKFWRILPEGREELTAETLMKSYEKVKGMLGSWEDLSTVNVMMQFSSFFVEQNRATQISKLERYLDIDRLLQVEKNTSKELKKLQREKEMRCRLVKEPEEIRAPEEIQRELQEEERILSLLQEELQEERVHLDRAVRAMFPFSGEEKLRVANWEPESSRPGPHENGEERVQELKRLRDEKQEEYARWLSEKTLQLGESSPGERELLPELEAKKRTLLARITEVRRSKPLSLLEGVTSSPPPPPQGRVPPSLPPGWTPPPEPRELGEEELRELQEKQKELEKKLRPVREEFLWFRELQWKEGCESCAGNREKCNSRSLLPPSEEELLRLRKEKEEIERTLSEARNLQAWREREELLLIRDRYLAWQYREVEERIQNCQEKLRKEQEGTRRELEGKVKEQEREMAVLRSQIQSWENWLSHFSLWKRFKENELKEKEIQKMKKKMFQLQNQISGAQSKKKKLELLLHQNKEFQREKEKLQTLEGEIELQKSFLGAVNSKTGLPFHILSRSCAALESAVNSVLGEISRFTIKISFDDEGFNFLIKQGGLSVPAAQGSGFQRFLIDLSLRLALTRSGGFLPGFLICDEGFSSADTEHRESALGYLENLHRLLLSSNSGNWMLIIGHIECFQQLGERDQLRIEQREGASFLLSHPGSLPPSLITDPKLLEAKPKKEVFQPLNTGNQEMFQNRGGKMVCRVCGSSFLSLNARKAEKHLETKKHQEALLQRQKRNAIPGLEELLASSRGA